MQTFNEPDKFLPGTNIREDRRDKDLNNVFFEQPPSRTVKSAPIDFEGVRYKDSKGRDITGNPVGAIPFVLKGGETRPMLPDNVNCKIITNPQDTIHRLAYDCSLPSMGNDLKQVQPVSKYEQFYQPKNTNTIVVIAVIILAMFFLR